MKRRSKKLVHKPAEIVKICQDYFCKEIKINSILLNKAFTGNRSFTTVFQNDHNEIFALCVCDEILSLADVKNIIKQMGMKAEAFLPPKGNEEYFNLYAKKSFEAVFPGRKSPTDQDLNFYKSFAPYSPALVKIAQVDGEIKHFDTAWNKWISAINFTYYRVRIG